MIDRYLIVELEAWADRPGHKPLVLRGARQVGKSTLVEQFSKRYDTYLKLNLENKAHADLFREGRTVQEIIPLIYFINKTAYSGMIRFNARGEYNVPYGRYKNFCIDKVTKEHSDLLRNTEICNEDYQTIFERAKPDDFIFLDPPYDCIFSDYGNQEYRDGFNEDAHKLLAENIKKLNCRVLMVIGRTALTEELYGDMIVDEYDKSYSVNIRNRFHSEAKHILVTNY